MNKKDDDTIKIIIAVFLICGAVSYLYTLINVITL